MKSKRAIAMQKIEALALSNGGKNIKKIKDGIEGSFPARSISCDGEKTYRIVWNPTLSRVESWVGNGLRNHWHI
mgnify:CR=1 FL=1